MTKQLMPREKDWEQFWVKGSPQPQRQPSWSKKRILSVLDQYVASRKNALDAGCGSGFFSAYFCGRGMKTTALDYSDQALAMAQKATSGQAKTVKTDLLEDVLSRRLGEPFDLIFTDGLFEHFSLADQDVIMQNFVSVLAPGGVIVTFVPNLWSPWELIRPFYMPGIKEVPFQLKNLRDLNARNCLDIIEIGGVNTIPFRHSPDKWLGRTFGMLLYSVSQKQLRRF